MARHPSLLLLLLSAGAFASAQPPLDEQRIILIQPYLERTLLGEDLTAYPLDGSFLVPLGEVMRLLGVGIQVDSQQGTASGFFIDPARTFILNRAAGTAALQGKTLAFQPAQVIPHAGDLMIDVRLLRTWFELDIQVYPRDSLLQIKTDLRLPIQDLWEREQKYDKLQNSQQRSTSKGAQRSDAPPPGSVYQKDAYRFWEPPSMDGTFSAGRSKGSGTSLQGSLLTAGDVLWMSSQFTLSRDAQGSYGNSRGTLFREDPGGGLFGFLHARRLELGDLFTAQSLPLVGSMPQGRGVIFDNFKTGYRSNFSTRTFRGRLQEGWTVELYQNGGLQAFRRSGPDGGYEFKDVPLRFGLNQFRLLFIGPNGQRFEQTYRLDIAQDTPKQGEFYYRLSTVEPRRFPGAAQDYQVTQRTSMVESDLGLTDWLSAQVGYARMGLHRGNRDYVITGLGAFFPFLGVQVNAARDHQKGPDGTPEQGRAYQAQLLTGYEYSSLSLRHATYQGGFRRLDGITASLPPGQELVRESALEGSGSIQWGTFPLSGTLGISRQHFQDQKKEDRARITLTTGLGNYHVSQTLATVRERDTFIGRRHEAITLLSYSSSQFSLQGEGTLERSASKTQVRSWALQADYRTTDLLLYRAGLRGFTGGLSNATGFFGVSRQTGPWAYGIDANISRNGTYYVGLRASLSVQREPRTRYWARDASSMSNLGSASVVPFLDGNGNGRRDPGEKSLEDVRFVVSGNSQPDRAPSPEIAFLTHLPRAQEVDIQVDAATLPDTSMHPGVPAVVFVPRPGHVHRIDYPIAIMGEITGTSRVLKGKHSTELGGLELELVDAKAKSWKVFRTSYDGFFELQKVPLGEWTLRVTPAEISRLKLNNAPERRIRLTVEQNYAEGQDIVIQAPEDPSDTKQAGTEAPPSTAPTAPPKPTSPAPALNTPKPSGGTTPAAPVSEGSSTPTRASLRPMPWNAVPPVRRPQSTRPGPSLSLASHPRRESPVAGARWTIQLLTARHASTIQRTRALLGRQAQDLRIFRHALTGYSRVCLGSFSTRSEAEAVRKALPYHFFFGSNRPVIIPSPLPGVAP